MKVVILAAGYGTRMYPLTKNIAKPLLPIGGQTALDFICSKVVELNPSELIILSNNKFINDFLDWKNNTKTSLNITIMNEGSNNPLELTEFSESIKRAFKNINEDCLLLGGDNIFEFDLKKMIEDANGKNVLAITKVNNYDEAKQYGVVEVNEGKITSYEEKPITPKSLQKTILCRLFNKETVKLICEKPLDAKTPLITWLLNKGVEFKAFEFNERCVDIGDLEKYNTINIHGGVE